MPDIDQRLGRQALQFLARRDHVVGSALEEAAATGDEEDVAGEERRSARGARQVRSVAVGVARRVDAGDRDVSDFDDRAVRDGAVLPCTLSRSPPRTAMPGTCFFISLLPPAWSK